MAASMYSGPRPRLSRARHQLHSTLDDCLRGLRRGEESNQSLGVVDRTEPATMAAENPVGTEFRAELRGFGTFSIRTHRDPRTGAPVPVGNRSLPFFKMSKDNACAAK